MDVRDEWYAERIGACTRVACAVGERVADVCALHIFWGGVYFYVHGAGQLCIRGTYLDVGSRVPEDEVGTASRGASPGKL